MASQEFAGKTADYTDDPFSQLIERLPTTLLEVASYDNPLHRPLEVVQRPHQSLDEIRDRHGPVVQMVDGKLGGYEFPDVIGFKPGRPVVAVTTFDAAMEMVRLPPDIMSTEGGLVAIEEVFGPVLSTIEGESHIRLRQSLNDSLFNARRIEARVDELMIPAAEYLVDRLKWKIARGETGDVMRDLALPMVYRPLSRIIGVPESAFERFIHLVEQSMAGYHDFDAAINAAREIKDFFREELEARRQSPEDDAMSRLLQQDKPALKLGEDEIVDNITFLLPAALDTTRHQVTAMVAALMQHPDQYRAVAEAPDERVVFAVDECMRYLPSAALGAFRLSKQESTIAGVTVPANAHVFLAISAINRDPAHWEQPNVLNVTRRPGIHFGFSAGRHICIGQNLARRSLQILLRALVDGLPTLRAAGRREDILLSGLPQAGPWGGLKVTA